MTLRVAFSPVVTGLFVFTFLGAAAPGGALAQSAATPQAAITTADYARAERFLAAAANPLVVGGTVNAAWLPDDRFTYRSSTGDGAEFMLVDPVKKTRTRAFDHERMAAALATAEKFGFGPGYLDEFPARIRAVTLEQANAAMRKHFFADRLHLIVAGDLEKIPE